MTLVTHMATPTFSTLVLALSFALLISCSNDGSVEFTSQPIDTSGGISRDTLDLIYYGPKGFTLDYFPRQIIQSNHVASCEISDSTSAKTVRRKVSFDRNGNIVKDDNNYFQYWFQGTVRGSYLYSYDSSNKLSKMVGIPTEDSKDSVMTIYNYARGGQLYSRDHYKFEKKLKPGADRHLAGPDDFEKYPTWNKLETYKFSHTSNAVVIGIFYEEKLTGEEKYVLLFDPSNRLTTVTKYRDTSFVQVIRYTYGNNSITEKINGKMNDGKDWTYNSTIITDKNGKQIEKIVSNDDGTERVKMTTTYNADGTISSIKYDNSVQIFRYTYY